MTSVEVPTKRGRKEEDPDLEIHLKDRNSAVDRERKRTEIVIVTETETEIVKETGVATEIEIGIQLDGIEMLMGTVGVREAEVVKDIETQRVRAAPCTTINLTHATQIIEVNAHTDTLALAPH